MSGARRRGRECALQILFQLEAGLERQVPSDPDAIKVGPVLGPLADKRVSEALDFFFDNFDAPDRVHTHAEHLVRGVMNRIDDVNALVAKHSEKWRLDRIALVDRNVRRLGACELMDEPSTPINVIIDEGVEIAQRFGSEGSGAFVNGILDAIAHDVRAPSDEG